MGQAFSTKTGLAKQHDSLLFNKATRYDKTAINFLGAIHLAASIVWLIHYYRFPFRAHQEMVAASYFARHF